MDLKKQNAYKAVLVLGIVSLLGDIVYEGSRGIIPDYFNFLGASATVVGLVVGLGEFFGYGIRLVSGVFADRTRAYWLFTFLGYGLIVGIPLLAISQSWQVAAIFIMAERLGKALRSPSRDVILSAVSRGVGTGKAFGIHEFMDQIGAVIGPIIVFFLIFYTSNYSLTFAVLSVPFLIMLFFLVRAFKKIGRVSAEGEPGYKNKLVGNFSTYVSAVALNTLGLIPVPIILFRVSQVAQPLGQAWLVPLVYALVQLVDAPAALISGHVYDKTRGKVLLIPFFLSLFPSLIIVSTTEIPLLIMASAIFGLILGMQESIYRAAVADMTPLKSRGRAYGIFHAVHGSSLLISAVTFGAFLDARASIMLVLGYVLVTQITAIVLLVKSLHSRD